MRKTRRDWLILFGLALIIRLTTAVLITRPGYMDAAYYAAGAINLGRGNGFSEPFIWNYLNNPSTIPHPGFLYWMPLPSLVAAPFAALFPDSFFALQLPFVILSSLLPVITYSIAWQTTERRRAAWAAGLLMLFSGFFFPYWTLPETFAPFALFGSLSIWMATNAKLDINLRLFLAGALVGLAHLTRADGILLLPILALAPLLSLKPRSQPYAFYVLRFTPIFLGYLLVMTPWFLRNLSVIGAPLSSAGTKTLWLTDYDDLFCYDCDLSLQTYLAWGWGNILRSKLFALWTNFQRFLAEDGMIFLLPLACIGFYRLRKKPSFILSMAYLLLIYVFHSIAFTFPGWRGGFFHASAASLPFLYAAAMEGLDASVGWIAQRRRSWRPHQARKIFTVAAIAAAAALSIYVTMEKLPIWREADEVYQSVDQWLKQEGVSKTRIMVNDPPSFWYHTGRYAVVVPNEDPETLLKAADKYDVRYVLLDQNRPRPLAADDQGLHPRLHAVAHWAERETILYAVKP